MPFSPGLMCVGAMELLRAKSSRAARSAAGEAKRGFWDAVVVVVVGLGLVDILDYVECGGDGEDGIVFEEMEDLHG